jgi:hypothetical protein
MTFARFLCLLAIFHIAAFICWSCQPIEHHYQPTGNWIVDNIAIPVAAITLIFLVFLGLIAPIWPSIQKRWEGK